MTAIQHQIPNLIKPQTRKLPGSMNRTEERYAERLNLLVKAGEIVRYAFESMKFRLAANTFYTPDFMLVFPEHIEFHEIKGFWRDDARVKLKVAAEMYPEFVWKAVEWKKKQWEFEEI